MEYIIFPIIYIKKSSRQQNPKQIIPKNYLHWVVNCGFMALPWFLDICGPSISREWWSWVQREREDHQFQESNGHEFNERERELKIYIQLEIETNRQ